MIIEIRIVVDVPKEDEDNFHIAMEKITQTVREQFPHLSAVPSDPPVTVTIRDRDMEKK